MKHPFISKRYWNNISTPMGKSVGLAREYDDLINLSLGDPDLTTDQRIIQAAFKDAVAGHTHYTDSAGYMELRQEICNYYQTMFDHHVILEECMVTTSGCHAMWLVLETILDDGDEVIIHEPYFTPYIQQVELARGKAILLKTYEENGFQIDTKELKKLITNRTKAIILNTPNNPTGVCFSRSTLEDIAKVAIENDLIVIADDIYTAFCFQEPFLPIRTLEGMRERTITIGSFSKNYCMTGWRIGYVLAPPFIINTMIDVNENNVFTAPSISQRAALHALQMRNEIQPFIVEEFKKRVFYAYERIQKIKVFHVLPPEGSIYLFVNIKKTGLSSNQFVEKLLREAHVLVIPGNAFGESGEGYIRIALTVDVDTLKEAFDRIEKIFN
ncbi:MAG: pyridoxal phosphate-dependent aminotransferase [Epulopiscium sp.]|nr:pyridoxal phosphate-dependent aminotransferase [Candidatus Epulonipiscium sp.]